MSKIKVFFTRNSRHVFFLASKKDLFFGDSYEKFGPPVPDSIKRSRKLKC